MIDTKTNFSIMLKIFKISNKKFFSPDDYDFSDFLDDDYDHYGDYGTLKRMILRIPIILHIPILR